MASKTIVVMKVPVLANAIGRPDIIQLEWVGSGDTIFTGLGYWVSLVFYRFLTAACRQKDNGFWCQRLIPVPIVIRFDGDGMRLICRIAAAVEGHKFISKVGEDAIHTRTVKFGG